MPPATPAKVDLEAPAVADEPTPIAVYQARMTETDGLTAFDLARPSRREWREAEQEIIADAMLAVTRVPAAWARWLLEEAHRRALAAGRTPPRRYAEVRHLLERPL